MCVNFLKRALGTKTTNHFQNKANQIFKIDLCMLYYTLDSCALLCIGLLNIFISNLCINLILPSFEDQNDLIFSHLQCSWLPVPSCQQPDIKKNTWNWTHDRQDVNNVTGGVESHYQCVMILPNVSWNLKAVDTIGNYSK